MSSAPLPKAARGAVFAAFLIALVSGISVRSGPIMLLGVCLVSVFAAFGILLRRVWSAFGFALLLALAILAMLFFAITGQNSGSFGQILVSVVLYSGVAGLFLLAGLSLRVEGAKKGSPIPWILIALLFSGPFIYYRPVSVSSDALAPALLSGDFLLVDRFAHPAVGEIIAFRSKGQIALGRITAAPSPNKYEVPGFGEIATGDIVGRPKFIYDSLEGDATHAPIRRWDRVFRAL
jgi:hypothetical protein